eukprot:SAG22_NODE_20598_length_264_cov_0.866667_1_plen_39_part_01
MSLALSTKLPTAAERSGGAGDLSGRQVRDADAHVPMRSA